MPRLPEVRQFLSSGGLRVYRIPCKVLAELTARVYLVLGAGAPTLVDAGSGQGESTRNILDGFEAVRREFGESVRAADVKRIIVTHGHLDHYGGLADLLAHATQAEVWIHPLDSGLITAHAESVALARHAALGLFRTAGVPDATARDLLAHHWLLPDEVAAVTADVKLLDRDEIDGIRVLHTPGHSPGHVCLLADDLLLCGDHILARTIPQLWPESLRPYQGLGHYLESLRAVRTTRGIRLALPSHEPVIEDVYHRIDEVERSQRRRIGYVVDVVAQATERSTGTGTFFGHRERPEQSANRAEKGASPLGRGCPCEGPTIWDIARTLYQQTTGFYALLAFLDTAARVEYLHGRGRLGLANLGAVRADPQTAWRYRAKS